VSRIPAGNKEKIMMRTIRTTVAILALVGLLLPWEGRIVFEWLIAAVVFPSPLVIPLACWIIYCVMSADAAFRGNYKKGVWMRLVLLAIATFLFMQIPFSPEITLNNVGYVLSLLAYVLGIIFNALVFVFPLTAKEAR
jgi:hypothetical protein